MRAHKIEEEAWRVFERASGHDREKFRLERVEGGWVVRWADHASTPMGMAPWVIADDGEAMRVGYPLSLKTVLAEVARRRTP